MVAFTFEADARARYDAPYAFLTGDAPRVEVVTGPWSSASRPRRAGRRRR